jgi:hypothetical protein
MKLMADIVDDVISDVFAGKSQFITIRSLLEDVEHLHNVRSKLTHRLDDMVIMCTNAATVAGNYKQ